MAEIDVRESETINVIRFSEDGIIEKNDLGQYFISIWEEEKQFQLLPEEADNLILALQKAKEIWFK